MRRELFDELVASIKEMKAGERGALKPARVTRPEGPEKDGLTRHSALGARPRGFQDHYDR